MIVPMKKVFLVVLEKERRDALKSLRKLGVVHVEEVQGNSEQLSQLKDKITKIEKALSVLTEIKIPKKSAPAQRSASSDEAVKIAESVIALSEEKKSCHDHLTADTAESDRVALWGGVTPEDFLYLSEKGIYLSMYEIPADKYSLISKDVKTLLVNSDKSICRFLVMSSVHPAAGERPEGLPAEAYQVVMPHCSTDELKKSVAENTKRIEAIEKEITSDTKYIDALKQCQKVISADTEFENLYSGMGCEESTEEKLGSAPLSWLSGFVPAEDLGKLQTEAKTQKWGLVWRDPADDDSVPTKLKNSKLVSLIYPVSDFLGTVPGYNEYDISGWFLLFFSIFFGMIFGDAGYGSLLILTSIAGIVSAVSKKKSVGPGIKLLFLLGVMTMIWGAVTCTWFGLTPEQLPSWIKNLSVPALSSAVGSGAATKGLDSPVSFVIGHELHYLSNEMWVKENLQIFCFTLALIQLSIAHLKGIVHYHKTARCLGELGSFLMLCGMYYVVLSMVVDGHRFPLMPNVNSLYIMDTVAVSQVCLTLVAVGFVLNFTFVNYAGNILKSVLESCKNIVSVLLGVVNVFSDIVSYIRLWAVALAGSAISATVNSMAGPTFGHAIIFLGILLLVFGHGLNMVLNVLSVIVHGVRLNTLEFSSHLGMSWSGFKYKPFGETEKK